MARFSRREYRMPEQCPECLATTDHENGVSMMNIEIMPGMPCIAVWYIAAYM